MQERSACKPLAAVVEDAYATWLWVDERVEAFPAAARRSLGRRIVDTTLDALQATVACTFFPKGAARIAELENANRSLAIARILLRAARDRRYLSIAQHEYVMARVDTWGRQLGGWLRAERQRKS